MKNAAWSEWKGVLLFALIGGLFTLPTFCSDFLSGHNVATHLMWSKHFAEQFWAGDVYPRWLMGMNDGLGSPAFFFYFPLPYFITSLFHAPFLNLDPSGWLQLGLSCALAFMLSGITSYAWLRELTEPTAAIVGAIVYMFIPYHLLVDLYYRFAFTEFWAFVFIPLCLLFSRRLQRREKFGFLGLALSYAFLFLTHLPTVLIFSPLLAAYIVFTGEPSRRLKISLCFAGAVLLGAGLSAFYFLPALLTQNNVSFSVMTRGEFHFANNFLFSAVHQHPKRDDLAPYLSFVSYSTIFTALVGLLSWMIIRHERGRIADTSFWGSVTILSMFMMVDASALLWQKLPLLPRIQFPYRFNILLTPAVTLLIAIAWQVSLGRSRGKLCRAWMIVIGAFLLSQIIVTTAVVYKRTTGSWDLETRNLIKKELTMSPEVPEYLPRWADATIFPVTINNDRLTKFFTVNQSQVEGSASITYQKNGQIVIQAQSIKPRNLTLRQLYYPGWVARVKQTGESARVFPSPEEGFLSVEMPAGDYQITLTHQPGRIELLGRFLSLVSLAVLTMTIILTFYTRSNKGTHP